MLQSFCDKRPRSRHATWALAAAAVLVVASGCGQKGPLYLPEVEPAIEREQVPEIERDQPSDLSG